MYRQWPLGANYIWSSQPAGGQTPSSCQPLHHLTPGSRTRGWPHPPCLLPARYCSTPIQIAAIPGACVDTVPRNSVLQLKSVQSLLHCVHYTCRCTLEVFYPLHFGFRRRLKYQNAIGKITPQRLIHLKSLNTWRFTRFLKDSRLERINIQLSILKSIKTPVSPESVQCFSGTY